MKRLHYATIYIACLLVSISVLHGQTPRDAIMMQKKEICWALTYEHDAWDHYWEGDLLRSNATIAKVSRTALMPMVAIGFTDQVNLLVGAPYIATKSSEPNGGKFAGAKGFQDISLVLKARLFHQSIGQGHLTFLSAAGFSTPMTHYLSDYRPYSIGFGANELSARGILQYQWPQGLYVRSSLAHLWRGQTQAERDYYYNNGSYYTSWMDVPNAWNYDAVVGTWLLDHSLRLEVSYLGLRSTSGDDIRRYNAGQPTNRVNVDQLGLFAQYYFKQIKGLGILGYCSRVIQGRNTGQASTFGVGVTYQFKL